MPSESGKQARFMAAEYGRAEHGEKTKTGMSKEKLREWVMADIRKKARRDGLRDIAKGKKHD